MTEQARINGRQISELQAIKCRLEHERQSYATRYECFEDSESLAMCDLFQHLATRLARVYQSIEDQLKEAE